MNGSDERGGGRGRREEGAGRREGEGRREKGEGRERERREEERGGHTRIVVDICIEVVDGFVVTVLITCKQRGHFLKDAS